MIASSVLARSRVAAARSIRSVPLASSSRITLPSSARLHTVAAASTQALPSKRRGLATLSSTENAPELGARHVAKSIFAPLDTFEARHVGPRDQDSAKMLEALGYSEMEQLIADTVSPNVRLADEASNYDQIKPLSESELAQRAETIAKMNRPFKSLIGMGYQNTLVPPVILRNVLENPAWYTSYTPYQPEISQGRLESLINFQTMVKSLTGLDLANASLLDEGTAAAEAMILAYGQTKSKRKTFLVDRGVLPQTLAVLRQRAKGFGIKVVSTELRTPEGHRLPPADQIPREDIIGALVQYPDVDGRLTDWEALAKEIKGLGGMTIAATDLLALTMIKPPGEWGADIALGNAARFGVPPGFGGPHAAFFAVRDSIKRKIPGRLVGLSKDARGEPAYRLALQTREQHIRREKATSNICTAQALLANMSAMYAVYHGPDGLRKIAAKVHALTRLLKHELTELGVRVVNRDGAFFDTLTIDLSKAGVGAVRIHEEAKKAEINLRRISDTRVGITLDETVSIEQLTDVLNVFAFALKNVKSGEVPYKPEDLLQIASSIGLDASSTETLTISSSLQTASTESANLPAVPDFARTSKFLQQPVFSAHRSETQMLRYIHSLQAKDLSLVHAMIPLGSCTMKLNSTSSMMLISKPEFSQLHPFAPEDQAQGYDVLIRELERDLCLITGFPAVSLQPNSGAQGEFAGLSVIRAYHESKGEGKRDVCLIPTSAHGTNPASAIMAGMRVVPVKTKADGSIDLEDLRSKAEQHKDVLAATMITEPATTGCYFRDIQEAFRIVHDNGGQVYLDGANLQAQVALTNPAIMGADVTHLNLHKTFSIPHGGGGPGVGPICVAEHLAPFLPGHPLASTGGEMAIDPISAAPWGSASILTIAWAYIKMLGWHGLKKSTETSLLAANYVAHRLKDHYKLKYTGDRGRVAHELLIDVAEFESEGLKVMDFAKRLIDYGFHPPTCSWPISTGLLIEITESESLQEIDRLIEAFISIRQEVEEIRQGKQPKDDNLLKNAPHTIHAITEGEWTRPYSRERAVYPVAELKKNKFWPPVSRIDDAFGDRVLVCECGGVEDYVN
ncbi:Glycine cleavage system P-protein, N-terminal [Kalmanozyma brasiliensis GHG001]|uniref:Glycine cleavage system P protein n=1 Tax=Kalmanozyma brasiliensis (strain GHG001) TaxID=1365824 RepID=V5EYY9_KALBG|nr:Glycine cleavage system P-protein, N-terminal [Kalmanozyma brasiliensis GHG001]EST09048.1 Glycine cleavage system P-protein, N-terminal [Kalmanozyma brasiliensis GHG001]